MGHSNFFTQHFSTCLILSRILLIKPKFLAVTYFEIFDLLQAISALNLSIYLKNLLRDISAFNLSIYLKTWVIV